jgi:hypothetical protein
VIALVIAAAASLAPLPAEAVAPPPGRTSSPTVRLVVSGAFAATLHALPARDSPGHLPTGVYCGPGTLALNAWTGAGRVFHAGIDASVPDSYRRGSHTIVITSTTQPVGAVLSYGGLRSWSTTHSRHRSTIVANTAWTAGTLDLFLRPAERATGAGLRVRGTFRCTVGTLRP